MTQVVDDPSVHQHDASISVTAWSLMAALLFVRMVLLTVPITMGIAPPWLGAVYETATYMLTLALVWVERRRLAEFHIDALALVLILACKPTETILLALTRAPGRYSLKLGHPASAVIWAAAIVMSVVIYRRRSRPTVFGLRWFGIGAAIGVVLAVVMAYPISFQISGEDLHRSLRDSGALMPISIVSTFLYQLGYAATAEEPLFRGFLWGYLRKLGWREGRILIFQALLFSLAHIYYMKDLPISFWIVVPSSAVVLGLLVWRSRTIACSMAAHAALNSLTYTLGWLIASIR
jgi:membrane protease YdiL (CAAX protease family)